MVKLILLFLLSMIHDFQCILHCIRTWSSTPLLLGTGTQQISETESEGENDDDLAGGQEMVLMATEHISETESEGEDHNDPAAVQEVALVALQLQSPLIHPLVQWHPSTEAAMHHTQTDVESQDASAVLYISETSDED